MRTSRALASRFETCQSVLDDAFHLEFPHTQRDDTCCPLVSGCLITARHPVTSGQEANLRLQLQGDINGFRTTRCDSPPSKGAAERSCPAQHESSDSGRDCVKPLRSSYTGLRCQRGGARNLLAQEALRRAGRRGCRQSAALWPRLVSP